MIYYVEDDANIRDLALYALRQAGLEARGYAHADDFFAACDELLPDAVLLDIMLPDVDGLQILRRLRSQAATAHVPVMMLTAKGTEYDTVVGLDAGADDYLAKPFGMMELVSRANALLRRAAAMKAVSAMASNDSAMGQGADFEQGAEAGADLGFSSEAGCGSGARAGDRAKAKAGEQTASSDVLMCGSVSLSVSRHRVIAGDAEVSLTLKEFELLRALMQNEERVLSRSQLLQEVWGVSFAGETRTVDVHIQTLRQKLAHACEGAEACIQTVRGVGYCMKEPRL